MPCHACHTIVVSTERYNINYYSKTFLKDHLEIQTTSLLRSHIHSPVFQFNAVLQLNNEITPVLGPVVFTPNDGQISSRFYCTWFLDYVVD